MSKLPVSLLPRGAGEKVPGGRMRGPLTRPSATLSPLRGARALVSLLFAARLFAQCFEGAIGNAAPQSFAPLSSAEVDAIVKAAATSLIASNLTIAVVDRAGRPLAVFAQSGAPASDADRAVGVARTAAFFSHNMAPLSSRTVRFISGIHFPPGVTNAPNAALYGIENTNRGCDFNVTFNAGKAIPPAKSLSGGFGPGIVTGKVQPDDADSTSVEAGGIPIYRAGKLVGGIGVVGDSDPQLNEFAAVTGAFAGFAPVPTFPLPDPGNVFIDGIRLPFIDQKLTDSGLERPDGTSPGTGLGTYVVPPVAGGCAPNEYLVGPNGGTLSAADVDGIVQRAITAAKKTRAAIRLPLNSYTRMVMAVADLDGTILAIYRMPDATVFSIDVAVAKAHNVIYFTTHPLPGMPGGMAVTNRTIGFGAQPLFPPGIDSKVFHVAPGPFFPIFLQDLANPCSQGAQPANPNQNGIVFFPGSTPLYNGATLVGGLGVSGDGVEQDDYVTYLAAAQFLPNQKIWADRVKIGGVRMPMFKFPRHPEGVTECGGKPCG
jgi:uncharacterized protein GlcG (DUF336 family)